MFRSVTFSFFPYIFLLWVEHGYFSTSCVDLCLSFTFLWALVFKLNIITNFWTTGNYFSRHFLAIWGDLFWYSAIFFFSSFLFIFIFFLLFFPALFLLISCLFLPSYNHWAYKRRRRSTAFMWLSLNWAVIRFFILFALEAFMGHTSLHAFK